MARKLVPTTPFDKAVQEISEGHPGAASVIALIHKEKPESLMNTLHLLDEIGIYGQELVDTFYECDNDLSTFFTHLNHALHMVKLEAACKEKNDRINALKGDVIPDNQIDSLTIGSPVGHKKKSDSRFLSTEDVLGPDKTV